MDKEPIYKQFKPSLDNYFKRLAEELEKRKLILPLKDLPGSYNVNIKNVNKSNQKETVQNTIFSQLFEFRNVATNVYYNLFPDAVRDSPTTLSKVLIKLEENGVLSLTWKNKKELLETLDHLESLLGDNDIQTKLEQLIKENNVNINKTIVDLLEYYGRHKAFQIFNSYHGDPKNQDGIDFILHGISARYSPLLFEFRFRRQNPGPDKKMLLGVLKKINEYADIGRRPFFFMVVYTTENTQGFERLKFRFRDILNSIQELSPYKNQIKFIPISIGGLNLLDISFEKFKQENIHASFNVKFQAQPIPHGFPERNDQFLDTIYEISNTEFKINVKPGTTKFWRLGFRFSKDGSFPSLAEGRHVNDNYADIHLSAGDIINVDKNEWGVPEQLSLTNYHAKIIEDTMTSLLNYKQEPVLLKVKSNQDSSTVEFGLTVKGQSLGNRIFDLHEFKFCRIFAWADHLPFLLDTDIEVTYK